MPLTLANADAALKEWYLPAVRYQLNNDTPMLNIIQQKTVEVRGRRAVLALRTSRNGGIGARADGGTLPTAGNQRYAEERVPLRYNYAVGQVTGPTIAQTDSDRGSFIRGVDSEMDGMTEDLKRDINRQLWGTSNGVIATCGVTGAVATIVLAAGTLDSTMRQFFIGQRVDIGTLAQLAAGTGGRIYNATITAIVSTPGSCTITLDSAVAATAGTDFVAQAGSGGIAPQKELTGLQTIVAASGILYNVDPASEPTWVSRVDANGGTPRAISENLMGRNVQLTQILSGEWVTHLISSDGVHRAYANLLMGQKRYPGARELPGGYTAVDFAAAGPIIPVTYDRDCPSGVTASPQTIGGNMFGLNRKRLFFGSASDWDFLNRDGSTLHWTGTTDAYSFVLFRYADQFTDKRNAHFRLSDITEA
jgi:hypothetical protein